MKAAIHILSIWLLCLLPLVTVMARADRATVQPRSIVFGEIAEFVIEYDSSIPSLYALDTSELEKEFELLQKDSRVIRLKETGKMMHRMQWRMQITPRRSGRLQIPPIRYGAKATPPIIVEVAPAAPVEPSAQQVYLELHSAPRNPYVGQQTQLQTRLYHNTRIADARLIEPRADKLLIRRSAAERTYRVERNGEEFQVLQQDLVLFPQSSGLLELSPAAYSATVDDAPHAAAPAAGGKRRIFRRSAPLRLQVRPPPEAFSGRFWLPATELQLSQHWSRAGNNLRTGDSLDWTLTIIADGLPAESLPRDLLARNHGDFRIYADQAALSNHFEDGRIVGRLEQRFAVVLTAPGRMVLPPLSLKWWNVNKDLEVESRLEGRSFKVEGENVYAQPGPISATPFASISKAFAAGPKSWLNLFLALAGLLIVFSPCYALRRRIACYLDSTRRRRRRRQKLKQACMSNDAAAARAAILEWARAEWPRAKIFGLSQVADISACTDLRQRLAELDVALFAAAPRAWQGQPLWRAITACRRLRRRQPEIVRTRLPALYPDQDSALSSKSDQPSTGSKRAPYLPA